MATERASTFDDILPIITLILGAVVAFIFNWITTRTRFRHEERMADKQSQTWINQQLWQKRWDKYDQILTLLWKDLTHTSELIDQAFGIKSDEELLKRLNFDFRQKKLEFASHTTIGGFYISEGAVAALRDYNRRFAEIMTIEDYMEQLDEDYAALRKCLESVKKSAMIDLAFPDSDQSWLVRVAA